MPETLITPRPGGGRAFRKEIWRRHRQAALRQWRRRHSFHMQEGDRNLASLLEMFLQMFREPFIVQRYLKDVRKGDKRFILIEGRARRRHQPRCRPSTIHARTCMWAGAPNKPI